MTLFDINTAIAEVQAVLRHGEWIVGESALESVMSGIDLVHRRRSSPAPSARIELMNGVRRRVGLAQERDRRRLLKLALYVERGVSSKAG